MSERSNARTVAALVGAGVVMFALSACGTVRSVSGGTTIFASAPTSIGAHMLGRPFDARFQPVVGPEGTAVFANDSGHVVRTEVNAFEHRSVFIEDSRELAANASAWGVASASLEAGADERYAAFRAYQVNYVLEVDDTQEMRSTQPGAVYYLARVYFGHRYEMVFHGSARRFHAGIRADFDVASGGLEAWAHKSHVEATFRGRGMTSKGGDAIFARTPEEVETRYSAEGPPVPIFVDYRAIPRVAEPDAVAIGWLEPARFTVRYGQIQVVEDGTFGTSTWSLGAWCKVGGQEIFTDEHVWNNTEVSSGGVYPLSWAHVVDAVVGDVLECGTNGHETESGQVLVEASFRFVVADAAVGTSGTYSANGGGTNYVMSYEVLPGVR